MTPLAVALGVVCGVLVVALDRAQQDVKRLRRINQFLVAEEQKRIKTVGVGCSHAAN